MDILRRGRPSKAKQTANEKKMEEYYHNWKSAIYTAKQLGLNRHTVEKYFQKLRATEIEEKGEEFKARQRNAKNQCLAKLDEIIHHKERQLQRFEDIVRDNNSTDTADDSQRFEVNYSRISTDLANLYQQKADIEMSATLDVKLEELVQEKYAEFSEQKAK